MSFDLTTNPKYVDTLVAIKIICKDQNFSAEELHHRARLMYLMNKINFWVDLPVLLEELNYQRSLPPKE